MRTLVFVLLSAVQIAGAQSAGAGAYVESAAGREPLSPMFVWSPILPRNVAWPIDRRHQPEIRLDESTPLLHVSQPTPSMVVSGLPASGGWHLVALHDRSVRLRRKNAYGSDFLTNAVFEDKDRLPLAFTPVADGELRVRPAAPLAPGAYLLCGQLQDGGWMRMCFGFQVDASR